MSTWVRLLPSWLKPRVEKGDDGTWVCEHRHYVNGRVLHKVEHFDSWPLAIAAALGVPEWKP